VTGRSFLSGCAELNQSTQETGLLERDLNGSAAPTREALAPRWYAAYTRAHHEKKVAEHLAGRAIEHYLPLYRSIRRWKDRRVTLSLPLFPSYVFVRLASRDRSLVFQIPGVVRLLGNNGAPSALPDGEIEALRDGLNQSITAEPHPYLQAGRRVQIKSGPLRGIEGIVVRRKGNLRLVVSIDLLMRSIIVDVDVADLELSVRVRK
jgi:transcription antitermination factor NusG